MESLTSMAAYNLKLYPFVQESWKKRVKDGREEKLTDGKNNKQLL